MGSNPTPAADFGLNTTVASHPACSAQSGEVRLKYRNRRTDWRTRLAHRSDLRCVGLLTATPWRVGSPSDDHRRGRLVLAARHEMDHERTKHSHANVRRTARFLDWENRPNSLREYLRGANADSVCSSARGPPLLAPGCLLLLLRLGRLCGRVAADRFPLFFLLCSHRRPPLLTTRNDKRLISLTHRALAWSQVSSTRDR